MWQSIKHPSLGGAINLQQLRFPSLGGVTRGALCGLPQPASEASVLAPLLPAKGEALRWVTYWCRSVMSVQASRVMWFAVLAVGWQEVCCAWQHPRSATLVRALCNAWHLQHIELLHVAHAAVSNKHTVQGHST